MNNKAFTLIELMGVIIILGLLSLIAIPAISNILKTSQENVYSAQIKRIEDATNDWGLENMNRLPNSENGTVTIQLYNELQKGGYLPICITNPKTGQAFNPDLQIEIKYVNATKFSYTVKENTIKPTNETCSE